jgi:hypothetical protein
MPLSSSVGSSLGSSIDGLGDTGHARVPTSRRFAQTHQSDLSQNRILSRFFRESVLPRVGDDEEVARKEIDLERIADNTCKGIERFSQVSGSGREIHPSVGEEAQHRAVGPRAH